MPARRRSRGPACPKSRPSTGKPSEQNFTACTQETPPRGQERSLPSLRQGRRRTRRHVLNQCRARSRADYLLDPMRRPGKSWREAPPADRLFIQSTRPTRDRGTKGDKRGQCPCLGGTDRDIGHSNVPVCPPVCPAGRPAEMSPVGRVGCSRADPTQPACGSGSHQRKGVPPMASSKAGQLSDGVRQRTLLRTNSYGAGRLVRGILGP